MRNDFLFIPTYNCEKQITRVLRQLTPEVCAYFKEIIIYDNISSDQTVARAWKHITEHQLPVKVVINEENVNLGGTHKIAFKYAVDQGFDYCFILHGDDQAHIQDFKHIFEQPSLSHDLILGSRFSLESKRDNYSRVRTLGNLFFNTLASARFATIVPDFGGSGLNGFNVKFIQSHILPEIDTYDIDLTFHTYLLMKSLKVKAKVAFHPISWREYDQKSNVKLLNQTKKLFSILSRAKI